MNDLPKLTVISFVGPSGAGKTTAMKALAESYKVLEEKYIELNLYQLDNKLMLSKWAYINYWFSNILQAKTDGVNLLLTDRCPFDTCAYVNQGSLELLEVVKISMRELINLNIFIVKVLVTADFEILQSRIDDRLKNEKIRLSYHESNIDHNLKAYNFYRQNIDFWDEIIDTSYVPKSDLFKIFNSTILNILDRTS